MSALTVVKNRADLAAEINAEHERAFGKAREALGHARRAGELLLQAKTAVEHGEWLPWLAANVAFSERTARGYMRLASHWDELLAKTATVADLGLRDALGLLADKTPRTPNTDTQTRQTENHVHVVVEDRGDVERHVEHGDDDVQQPVHGDDGQGDVVHHGDDGDGEDHADGDVDAEPEPRGTRRLSRGARWANAAEQAIEAIENLIQIQGEFQEWRDGLPENLAGGAVAEKLDTVIEIDLEGALSTLSEARDADLPLGFGRD